MKNPSVSNATTTPWWRVGLAIAIVCFVGAASSTQASTLGTMSIPGLTTTPVQITAVAWDGQTGAVFPGILVTKVPDTTSPLLFAAMTGGTALLSVQIIAGSATYDLASVLLTEMSTQPDAKGHVTETVRLTCAKMTVTVAGTSRCFDFQTNTVC
jgi:hypothetical protein